MEIYRTNRVICCATLRKYNTICVSVLLNLCQKVRAGFGEAGCRFDSIAGVTSGFAVGASGAH